MAQTTARPLTKYDYWELPEAGPRYQLINGDLFMAPAPNRFHQDISRTIQFEIMKYLEAEPVGILYDAPFDVVLTDINVFQPVRLRAIVSGAKKIFEINAIFFPVSLLQSNHQVAAGERNLQAANSPENESLLRLGEGHSAGRSH